MEANGSRPASLLCSWGGDFMEELGQGEAGHSLTRFFHSLSKKQSPHPHIRLTKWRLSGLAPDDINFKWVHICLKCPVVSNLMPASSLFIYSLIVTVICFLLNGLLVIIYESWWMNQLPRGWGTRNLIICYHFNSQLKETYATSWLVSDL